jgi:hypothetical protein
MDIVLTHIWSNNILVILCEENHENFRAVHGHCAHTHLKQWYTGHSIWGKSREWQGCRWYYGWSLLLEELECNLKARPKLCSLTPDEIMTGTKEAHVKAVARAMNALHAVTPNFCVMHFNIIFASRPTFSSGAFALGLRATPSSVFGPKSCNLTCLASCTFLLVAEISHCPVHHSFCTAELRCPHSFELSCILLRWD